MSHIDDSPLPQRRSIRLAGYDYRLSGAYFITICTHNQQCTLGQINDNGMCLSSLGEIVHEEWFRTAQLRPSIELGHFVIMPNHVHGIIVIVEDHASGAMHLAPTPQTSIERQFGPLAANSISSIVGSFKAAVTRQANRRLRLNTSTTWQRNY